MTKHMLSGVLMWTAVIAIIGGGFVLGLDPVTCALVLLGIVAALYFWGQP